MGRTALVVVLGGLAHGCNGGDEPACTGFGCPTVGEGASDPETASSPSTDESASAGTDATQGPSTSTSSSSTTTAAATSDDSSSATSTGGGSSSQSGADGSTGPACRGEDCGALGECFGLGVWASCTQFCEASDVVCIEAGCGGATVVYYDDVADCVDEMPSASTAEACDAPFMQGGGVSFGRCCCG